MAQLHIEKAMRLTLTLLKIKPSSTATCRDYLKREQSIDTKATNEQTTNSNAVVKTEPADISIKQQIEIKITLVLCDGKDFSM